MADKVKTLIEEVKVLTVLELSQLVKALEEEFGVSAAAPVAVSAAPAAEAASAAEEKTEFDVIIKSVPEKKGPVIKAVKEITGVGIMDAKTMVEAAPKAIKQGVSEKDAEEFKKKLIEAGADVEVK